MQTFRKLPTHAPKSTEATMTSPDSSPSGLSAGGVDRAATRARHRPRRRPGRVHTAYPDGIDRDLRYESRANELVPRPGIDACIAYTGSRSAGAPRVLRRRSASARDASGPQPLVLRRGRQLLPEARAGSRSPPSASMLAATGRSQFGAPGIHAFRNHCAAAARITSPPVLTKPASWAYCHFSGAARRPFSVTRSPDRGSPLHLGWPSESRIATEPVRDVEARIERRGDIEERVQES